MKSETMLQLLVGALIATGGWFATWALNDLHTDVSALKVAVQALQVSVNVIEHRSK